MSIATLQRVTGRAVQGRAGLAGYIIVGISPLECCFSLIRSLSQQRMDQDEYNSFSLLDGEDQEEDEWTDVETRVSDRESE